MTTLWRKSLVGDGRDHAQIREVAVAPGGGYCLAGSVRKSLDERGDWQADAWIVRLDAAGNVVWDRTLGGDDDEWGEAVAATHDGGCLLGARTGRHASRTWIVRLDARGKQIWERIIGESNSWSPDAIEPVIDGGFLVLGIMSDPQDRSGDRVPYWIARFSAEGALSWLLRAGDSEILYRRPGPHELELFRASPRVAVAASGGAHLSGPMKLPGARFGYSIAELDGAGALIHSMTLDASGHPDAFAMRPGLGHAVAFFEGQPGSPPRMHLTMFDARGGAQWRVRVPLSAETQTHSAYTVEDARMTLFPGGNVALVAERHFRGAATLGDDLWLVRFDRTGSSTARFSVAGNPEAGTRESLYATARSGDSLIVAGRTDWPKTSERNGRAEVWLRQVTLP